MINEEKVEWKRRKINLYGRIKSFSVSFTQQVDYNGAWTNLKVE